jgi:small subunit ribosomal protein S3e
MPASGQVVSKKRKFVADGVFRAELDEFLRRELGEDGYAGVEVRDTPMRTEIVIRATRTQNVLGEKGRRIRELTTAVQKRFKFDDGAIELFAERVPNRGLCAQAQCESIRFKLEGGLAVRRAANGVVRVGMEAGAKVCEVVIGGKMTGARAKVMKFMSGYLKVAGHAKKEYVQTAVRHVLLRSGVIGIKVRIMLGHDPTGMNGPRTPLPDQVVIVEPKADENQAGPNLST